MKVAVLGAGGTIAPAIVRDLAESDEVDALLLLDLDEGRAQQVAERYGGDRAGAAFADARASADQPGSLTRALEGCDVLVNSASYRVNPEAMGACLQVGSHYIDLGGLYWMTGRQLELAPQFERAGLLALLGIGSAPGKTNLMALHAVRELGAPAEAVHVSAAGRDLDPPPGFSVPYALRTLLDELTMRPVVLREGAPEEIDPMSPGGTVEFEQPIGAAETIYTLHSELLTFGDSFGCREASFRLSLSPDLLSTLRELIDAPEAEVAEARRGGGAAVGQDGLGAPGGGVRRGTDGSGAGRDRAPRRLGPGRGSGVHRDPGGGRRAAACPRLDHGPRGHAPRALHRA